MKPLCSNQKASGLTRVEILVVIATLGLLAFLVLYSMAGSYRQFLIVECASNLRYVALDYRICANENGGKFPMMTTVDAPHSDSLIDWTNYPALSNLFVTPKILHCPADRTHPMAEIFSTGFAARNVSYFTGLVADTNSPNAFLCGDDHFVIGKTAVKSGLLEISAGTPLHWDTTRHNRIGNISLADGSVQKVNDSGLEKLLDQTGFATNRFFIP